jgi:hypothetical protein
MCFAKELPVIVEKNNDGCEDDLILNIPHNNEGTHTFCWLNKYTRNLQNEDVYDFLGCPNTSQHSNLLCRNKMNKFPF